MERSATRVAAVKWLIEWDNDNSCVPRRDISLIKHIPAINNNNNNDDEKDEDKTKPRGALLLLLYYTHTWQKLKP